MMKEGKEKRGEKRREENKEMKLFWLQILFIGQCNLSLWVSF